MIQEIRTELVRDVQLTLLVGQVPQPPGICVVYRLDLFTLDSRQKGDARPPISDKPPLCNKQKKIG